MRLLVVNGSPRPKGSTGQLCKALMAGTKEFGTKALYVSLGEKKLSFCKGCRECSRLGKCPQPDDMAELISEIVLCDALVLASPSYWRDVTAQMKTFIDRCLPLCEYVNPEAMTPGRRGYSVAVRAGIDKSESLRLVSTFDHFFGHLNIKPSGMLTFEGISSEDDLTESHLEEAYRFGKDIGEQWNVTNQRTC